MLSPQNAGVALGRQNPRGKAAGGRARRARARPKAAEPQKPQDGAPGANRAGSERANARRFRRPRAHTCKALPTPPSAHPQGASHAPERAPARRFLRPRRATVRRFRREAAWMPPVKRAAKAQRAAMNSNHVVLSTQAQPAWMPAPCWEVREREGERQEAAHARTRARPQAAEPQKPQDGAPGANRAGNDAPRPGASHAKRHGCRRPARTQGPKGRYEQ